MSQQLAVLRSAGLVEERAEGRFRLYRLRAKPLGEVDLWLSRYRAHIERQLDTLGVVLDAMPDEPNEALERPALREPRPTDETSGPKRRRRS